MLQPVSPHGVECANGMCAKKKPQMCMCCKQEIRVISCGDLYYCLLPCVEFAFHPQHEMSLDSGIQLIEDFNYFKSKSRKRPRSLSLVSLNSSNWEEYWNTKVISTNGLNSKRMKLEQSED